MKRTTILTAIDVGTTKVCTLVAELNAEGNMRVVGVGITPSNGMHKGMVVNLDETRDSIRSSIGKAEQSSNYKVESAYIGVTGRHVTSTNNHGVISITRNDRLVRPDDLRRVLASAQSVKVPSDRKLLHVIPRSYTVDGQVGVKNPVGMHGYRLDVETHIITAAVASVQNLVKCVGSLGLDIDDLVLEPLASSEAVLKPQEREMGVILADIGGGTTDISVFREGAIWHTAVIPVAGYQMTRDLSLGLGISFEMAEQVKKQYGSVMPVFEGREAGIKEISQDGHKLSYRELSEIIRARTEELLRLIILELPQTDLQSLVPAGLVLTGGSSNLAGIDVLGRDILKTPVRVGAPINMPGLTEELCDPAYATAIGLLLWGAKHRVNLKDTDVRQRNLSDSLRRIATQFRKLFGNR
jgi:cell division protein FtsA